VLETQLLSDLITANKGPLETIAWQIGLDIALPMWCLWLLLKLIERAADQARINIIRRVEGNEAISIELQRRSTLIGLVLVAMKAPAAIMLPPLLLTYTFRSALVVVDILSNRYREQLPRLLDAMIGRISLQLIPLDSALAIGLSIFSVLFTTWFFIQLKNILIREVILVRAIRSGRKELERVLVPFSSLVTWAVIVATGINICGTLGINLRPVLAVGGAGGIAAGFASQQVLQNAVSGINIFLTRPFVVGDQVVFAGVTNLEGTVEGVEIMRTLLKTSDGAVVAVPNKLVADLIIHNRTRNLAGSERDRNASSVAAAAPLKRLLCFTVRIHREVEPQLEEVRAAIQSYLKATARAQLDQAGLSPDSSPDASESEAQETAEGEDDAAEDEGEGEEVVAAAEQAPAAAIVATSSSVSSKDSSAKSSHRGSSKVNSNGSSSGSGGGSSSGKANSNGSSSGDASTLDPTAAAAAAAEAAAVFDGNGVWNSASFEATEDLEEQPLRVSINMSKMDVDHIDLFVRCEILLPSNAAFSSVERQMEAILLGVSHLVREGYGGLVLW
jgi:small-conductance mechanosensitive channel